MRDDDLPRAARPRLLVCLDLMAPVVASDHEGDPAPAECLDNCRRLLAFARGVGWNVVHVHQALAPGEAHLRPIPGLAPLPSEAIVCRTRVSAFSSKAFRDLVKVNPNSELVIIGLSLGASCLSTALAAFDRGIRATLVEDAVASTLSESLGIQAYERVARSIAAPFARLVRTSDLIGHRQGLRVVEGGGRAILRGVS